MDERKRLMKKNKRRSSGKERKRHCGQMLRRVKCGFERIRVGLRGVEKEEAQGTRERDRLMKAADENSEEGGKESKLQKRVRDKMSLLFKNWDQTRHLFTIMNTA